MPNCQKCGENNPERARFCLACGTPFAESSGDEIRKCVTVLFADLANSTRLADKLDPESFRALVARFFDEMTPIVARHAGTIEQFAGDALLAVYGIPTVHEDDALRAVRSANEMMSALNKVNDELSHRWGQRLQMRIAINTGEVVSGADRSHRYNVLGDPANTAARLQAAAKPGDLVVDDATFRLVEGAVEAENLGPIEIRGKDEAVVAYRVLQVHPEAPARKARREGRLVGRDMDLGLLRHTYQRTLREHSAHLFTILGSPGIGKSRLVRSFLEGLGGDACVMQGRALSYGEGITYWPLVEALRPIANISDHDPPETVLAKISDLLGGGDEAQTIARRLGQGIGLFGEAGDLQETVWAARRLFETLAERHPVIAVFDDVHWAEPTFLRLIEQVVAGCARVPLLMICTAREDLLEGEEQWGLSRLNASIIRLTPLRDDETDDLIADLLGGEEAPLEVRARIHEASGGNPLFIEEVLAMLTEKDSGGDAVAAARQSNIPPTIQALLHARLEQLPSEERYLLERASVMGTTFDVTPVAALLQIDDEALRRQLQDLVERDLIYAVRSVETRDAYAFRHALIRDAAYHRLPKAMRADLHARFAEWLEASDIRRVQYEEILGYHFEQSALYRTEVASLDDQGRSIAGRAAIHLWNAGRRAVQGDEQAAVKLLARAAGIAPDDHTRLAIAPDLADALRAAGELGRARAVLEQAVEEAHGINDGVEAHARLLLLDLQLIIEPEGKTREIEDEIARLIPLLEHLGDEVGLARAWRTLASVYSMWGKWGSMEEPLRTALVHARRANHLREETEIYFWLAAAAFWGPSPVDEAIRLCRSMIDEIGEHRRIQALVVNMLGGLHAMRGDFRKGRELMQQAKDLAADLGIDASNGAFWSGPLELLAGNAVAAEEELRAGCALLRNLGDQSGLSTLYAMLAEALYAQARLDEAEQASAQSEELAATEDLSSQVMWRTVRAKVHARKGHMESAEGLARDAIEIAANTDMLNMQGDALLSLAEVLAAGGKPHGAEAEEAVRLYEAKGNLIAAGRARANFAPSALEYES